MTCYPRRMTGVTSWLRRRVFPPVPGDIRDDVALLRAHRVETLTPALFLTLAATTPTAIYAGVESVHPVVRIGFPIILASVCLIGVFVLWRNRGRRMSPRRARRVIAESTVLSGIMGAMCSLWTVLNWLAAPPSTHSYYAIIMAMGSLATAYCLSSIRVATFVNLAIGLVPIAALMLSSGRPSEAAAGTSLVVATLFLLRMVIQQHGQLVDLLLLQRQMRELAHSDALTGLPNRRAFDLRLDEEIAKADGDTVFVIALLDLDGFKPVNDRHGHAAGDALLRDIAQLLTAELRKTDVVARLGGDEFAVLLPACPPQAQTLADALCSAVQQHRLRWEGQDFSVGASVGMVAVGDGRPESSFASAADVLRAADMACYRAKKRGRSRVERFEPSGFELMADA